MKNRISSIFDAVDAAMNIQEVQRALKVAENLDTAERADFLRRLRAEFSASARRQDKGVFAVTHIHALDEADLSKGYHIGYKAPAA